MADENHSQRPETYMPLDHQEGRSTIYTSKRMIVIDSAESTVFPVRLKTENFPGPIYQAEMFNARFFIQRIA